MGTPYKMKGSPMARNFGAPFKKDTKPTLPVNESDNTRTKNVNVPTISDSESAYIKNQDNYSSKDKNLAPSAGTNEESRKYSFKRDFNKATSDVKKGRSSDVASGKTSAKDYILKKAKQGY